MKGPGVLLPRRYTLVSAPHVALEKGHLGLQVPGKGPRDGPGVVTDTSR